MANILAQKSVSSEKERILEILDEISKNFKRSVDISFARPLYYLEDNEVKTSIHNRNIVMLLDANVFYKVKSIIEINESYESIGDNTVYILEVPYLSYRVNYVLRDNDSEYNNYGIKYVRTDVVRKILNFYKINVWRQTEEYVDRFFYSLIKNHQFLFYVVNECYDYADKMFRFFLKRS
ncbi:MAG: hypothetical protein QXS19_07135 [Candidatus Methanomethylicia archaeon]